MLKKILYVVASLIIGFLVIITSVFTNFNSVLFNNTATAVADKEYMTAERYFSQVINEDKFFVGDFENTHVEVYSAINDRSNVVYDAEGKKTTTTYYTLESSIQISVFHLPEAFTLEDKYEEDGKTLISQGGVELSFVGEEKSVLFPYYSDKVDYYTNYSSYSFLPLSIFYLDYVTALTEKEISLDAVIDTLTIYDGDHDVTFTVEFEEGKTASFDTTFHNAFHETLTRYNKIQKEEAERSLANKELSEEETEALKAEAIDIEAKYSDAFKTGTYVKQHAPSVIYESADFLVPTITSAVIFLAIDILLAWYLFRKKKVPTYVPANRKTQTAAPARQPEQFSRELFEVQEDVVETTAEEVTSTETTDTTGEE